MPIIVSAAAGTTTFLALQDEVLDHGFDPVAYRDRIKSWLNEGQHRVARQIKLPGLLQEQTITTSSGTASYALPTNLIRMVSVRDHADRDLLEAHTPSEYDELADTTGRPQAFTVVGDTLTLHPTPGAAYDIRVRYYRNVTDMSGPEDPPSIPADYAHLLVSYALYKAYRSEDDSQFAQFFFTEFSRDLAELKGDMARRLPSRVKQIQGMWPRRAHPRFRKP